MQQTAGYTPHYEWEQVLGELSLQNGSIPLAGEDHGLTALAAGDVDKYFAGVLLDVDVSVKESMGTT